MLTSIFKAVYQPILQYPSVVTHLQLLLGKIVMSKDFVSTGGPYQELEYELKKLPRWPLDYSRNKLWKWFTDPTTGWYLSKLIAHHYPEYRWGVLPDEVRMLHVDMLSMLEDVQSSAALVLNDVLVNLDETVEDLQEKVVKLQTQLDLICRHLDITISWERIPEPPEPPLELEYQGENVIIFPGSNSQ